MTIRQGATFGPLLFTMFDPDEVTPVDLTGCVIRAQIRRRADSQAVQQALTVAITSALDGEYRMSLTPAQTAAIPAVNDPEDEANVYAWDAELQDSLGNVFPLYWGTATMFREVTR